MVKARYYRCKQCGSYRIVYEGSNLVCLGCANEDQEAFVKKEGVGILLLGKPEFSIFSIIFPILERAIKAGFKDFLVEDTSTRLSSSLISHLSILKFKGIIDSYAVYDSNQACECIAYKSYHDIIYSKHGLLGCPPFIDYFRVYDKPMIIVDQNKHEEWVL